MNHFFTTLALFIIYFNSFSTEIITTPKEKEKSIEILTEHLTQGLTSKKEKVTKIYQWITSNIEYDYKLVEKPKLTKYQDPEDVLKSKKTICTGYAELFRAMCEQIEVECYTVVGYVKDENFIEGMYLHDDYHAWSSFKIDEKWYLADPTWDAGYVGLDGTNLAKFIARIRKKDFEKTVIKFVQEPTTEHFMKQPDTFLLDHMPSHPMWQLKNNPNSIQNFEKGNLDSTISKNLDYEKLISEFQNLDLIDQYSYVALGSYEFNSKNTSIVANEYSNYIAILENKEVIKKLKKSKSMKKELASLIAPKLDTVEQFLQLAENQEKAANKQNLLVYKNYYKSVKKTNNDLLKLSDKTISAYEKNIKYIEKSNDQLNKLILKEYDPLHLKHETTDTYKTIPNEELIEKISNVRAEKKQWIEKMEENPSQNATINVFKSVNYLSQYLEYNIELIEFNNHQPDEYIARNYFKQDSLLNNATTLLIDSIQNETYSQAKIKEYSDLVKAYKAIIKELKSKNIFLYDKVAEEMDNELKKLKINCHNIAVHGLEYNKSYQRNFSSISSNLNSIENKIEEQLKTEEQRDSEVLKKEKTRNERANKLFEHIDKRAKKAENFIKKAEK